VILAFDAFSHDHWRKLRGTNPLQRLKTAAATLAGGLPRPTGQA
jgi:hypothetical protein